MATRFYFPEGTAADVTPVANGSWGDTSEALNRKLIHNTKSNTAIAIGSRIGPWTVGVTALDRRYVSSPLGGDQTISGTVKAVLMAREYNNGDNSTSRLEIYVVHNDGSTVRGTCLAIGQYGPAAEYVNAVGHRNKQFADGDTITSVNALSGDRIVVVIGHADAAGATPEASCKFGDPTAGTDLAENETDTTENPGWIEFSANLTFSITTPKTLPATAGSTATFVRKTSKFLVSTSPGVATFIRKTSKFLTTTSPGVAVLAAVKLTLQALSAASAGVATITRIPKKILAATAVSVATFSRKVSKFLLAVTAPVATFVRKVSKTLAATSPGVATIAKVRFYIRALAATEVGVAVLTTKTTVAKMLSVVSTTIATLLKVLLNLKVLAVTEVSVVTLGKYRTYGTPFKYTAANWASARFFLEADFRALSGTARVRLYDETAGAAVADSEITTTSDSRVLLRSAQVTLVDTHQYSLQLGTTGANAGAVRGVRIVAVIG